MLLTVLLLSACTSSPQKSSANYVVDLEERKKITLPIDERTYYLSQSIFQFEKDGKEFLHFENTERNQYNLIFFDLVNQCEHKRVNLSKHGPNEIIGLLGSRTYGDSIIFLFEHNIGRTSIINDEGQVMRRYPMQVADGKFVYNMVNSYYYEPSFIKDSKIYLSQGLLNRGIKKDDWKDIHMFASLDLHSGAVERIPLYYPSIFNKDVYNPGGGYSFTYDYNYKEERLVCSFQGYDSLMVSDDLKTVKWFDGRSRYLMNLRPEVLEATGKVATMVKFKERAKYSHIMYDKYRDVYYRFAEHPYELSPDESPYVEPNGREFSVIVFNDQFEIIGETKFPGNKYFYKMSFVGRDGLYISENNEANPEFDENKLVFACFGLKDLE